MCGIAGGFGTYPETVLDLLSHRGPDGRGHVELDGCWLAHTRLAILDPLPRSAQPYRKASVVLSFNGEIWNFRELRAELEALGEVFDTEGDTEVLAAALLRWGEDALPRLQGMFALAWTRDDRNIVIARDRYGETPLHYCADGTFASELKVLGALGRGPAAWLPPGSLAYLCPGERPRVRRWYEGPPRHICPDDRETAAPKLYGLIREGVRERSISDVPVCALLSGGIDSTAVLMHAREFREDVVAYVATMRGKGRDPRFAREAAAYLRVPLVEVEVPEPTPEGLAEVIGSIEIPHKAQVEIGWACLHLAERIRADGFRVLYSGEGSDELWGSYGMSYHGIRTYGWFPYRRKLFREQHRKNFARCNKIFMARGLECRLPFLSTGLVEYALSLREEVVADGRQRPKALMQAAYASTLPAQLVGRPKLAFQDGIDLKAACGRAVADPGRFYAQEHRSLYHGHSA